MSTSKATHYCLIAGEQSGDQHAAALVAALRLQEPAASFSGVAGPSMRLQGVEAILTTEELSVMGFSDVFRALPRLIHAFCRIRNAILVQQPTAVVMVDYPGFNLRLARSLRRYGYSGRLIHYISPSVWAWGKGRKSTMAATLDLLMTIYPFEKAYFAGTALRVEYVGNPLVEALAQTSPQLNWRAAVSIPQQVPLVGIFPGSRLAEVERNLPLMLAAACALGYTVAISAANTACAAAIHAVASRAGISLGKDAFLVPRELAYSELMGECRAAIAKSGTVTLELALHGCPTVVTYYLTTLNRLLARYLFRINLPNYCIVNILAAREVFPEFIAQPVDAATLRRALLTLLQEGELRQSCLNDCKAIRQQLSEHSAARQAAMLVQEVASCSA